MRNKTILIICMVFLLLGTSGAGIPTAISPELKAMNHDAMDGNNSNSFSGNSFHGNTTLENANWYVIKFSSPSQINVTQMYIKRTYRFEDTRIEWDGYILTNLTYSEDGGAILETLNESESFFHIKIGQFSYTNDNLNRYTSDNLTDRKTWRYNFTIPPGTWYLICFMGETSECTQEVYFNTTNSDIEFLATSEGTGTHILLPEDFLGNVKKEILFQVGNLFSSTGDFDASDFIIGKGGMWKFKVNVIAIGKIGKRVPISFSMFGADVKLP